MSDATCDGVYEYVSAQPLVGFNTQDAARSSSSSTLPPLFPLVVAVPVPVPVPVPGAVEDEEAEEEVELGRDLFLM